jgi:hypothetical protein
LALASRAHGWVAMTPNVRCPRCDEERLVERIQTGRVTTYFCAVCSHAWQREGVVKSTVVAICAGSIFSCGYLLGAWTTRSVVESAARQTVASFSHQVDILRGRLQTLEEVCR